MIDTVLLNDTRIDNHHGCDTVVSSIEALCLKNGMRLIGTSPAHRDWRSRPSVIALMEQASLVIVNGEGTLHHDRPAGHALLCAGQWARDRGKTSALINMTWQENGEDSFDKLSAFDIVSVRESASLKELTQRGIAASRMPDLAAYSISSEPAERRGYAVCDSVHGTYSVALYRAMRPFAAQRLPIIKLPRNPVAAARWIRRHTAQKASLLSPATLISAARAALPDFVYQAPDRECLLQRLGTYELVVTGRFHMMIFCLATGTPFIALQSNTHKIEATAADAGVKPWRVIDRPTDLNAALIRKASHWHDDEAANVERYIARGRADIERLFAQIAHLARS